MLTLYVICFWVGLLLTLVLTLWGGGHGHHHFFHFDTGGHHGASVTSGPSPFNLNSLLAFLTGFGGVGYILNKTGFFTGVVILVLAVLAGILIAWLLFLVLVKVFLRGERVMRESEYDLTGQLAYVSSPIPAQGVGEIKYTLDGTTRSIGARSQFGQALRKETKVVVLEVVKGIATVIEFEERTEVH